jgi:hypothetical protein
MTLVWSIMRIHGLELVRRRLVLALLCALPIVLYFAMAGNSESFAVVTGGTLLTFSIAGPAVFIVLAGRQIDQRLALAGYKARHLILGRLLMLLILGFVVCSLFVGLVLTLSEPKFPIRVVLGVYLVAVVAVPFGLTLSSVLPGDLEAFLTMIGVVGVQLALPYGSIAGPIGPLYGPKQILYAANPGPTNSPDVVVPANIGITGAIAHTLLYTAALLMLAAYATELRSRVDLGKPRR